MLKRGAIFVILSPTRRYLVFPANSHTVAPTPARRPKSPRFGGGGESGVDEKGLREGWRPEKGTGWFISTNELLPNSPVAAG